MYCRKAENAENFISEHEAECLKEVKRQKDENIKKDEKTAKVEEG